MRETYTVMVNGHSKDYDHKPTDQEIQEFIRSHYPTGLDVIEMNGKRAELQVQALVTKNFVHDEEKGFIDRFEGNFAIIDVDGFTRDIPRSRLPKNAKPGDAVTLTPDEIRLDPDGKASRKKEINKLMNELWEE